MLKVNVETRADAVQSCDVVVITVRNFDLDDVLDEVAFLVKNGANAISLLNGVEHIEKLRRIVTDEKILGGSAYIDSRLGPGGEIIHRSQTPTIALGKIRGSSPTALREVAAAFAGAGIRTEMMEDLLEGLWRKYLFVMLGSFTAVAGAPIGDVLGNKWCSDTVKSLLDEFLMVAKSIGVELDSSRAEATMVELRKQRPEWTSLLYEDILHGRRTELDSLWGYMVRKAKENSIPTPLSAACYGILLLKEHQQRVS